QRDRIQGPFQTPYRRHVPQLPDRADGLAGRGPGIRRQRPDAVFRGAYSPAYGARRPFRLTVLRSHLSTSRAKSRLMASPAAPPGNLPIIRRLLREYMRGQWRILLPAIVCMVISALMTGALAWLLDPAIKLIFLEKRQDMLVIIPLAVVGVIV